MIYKNFGWHFLAKEVADFTNESFFTIMNTPAIEVAGLVALIQARTNYYGK